MAGKSTISITFKLDGDGKGFKQLANDADGLKKVLSSTLMEAQKFNTNAINFAALATGIDQMQSSLVQLQATMKDLTAGYTAAKQADTQLITVMHQRMNANDADIQSIRDLISAQKDLGVIGGTVQKRGAQQLATFLNQRKSLETLIPAMNNLIAQQRGLEASQEDAYAAGNMLGKAMQGQTTALRRVGITFTDAQDHVMKYGDESQRAAMLAQIITDNVGNMNAELGKTDIGKQKQLENQISGIKNKLGSLVQGGLPFVTMAAQSAIALGAVIKLSAGIKALIFSTTAWDLKNKAASVSMILLGLRTSQTAVVTRIFSAAMTSGAFTATAFKIALRGLMISTGVGAAIAGVTMLIEYFVNSSNKAADASGVFMSEEEKAKKKIEDTEAARNAETEALQQSRAALEIDIARLKDFRGSKQKEKTIIEEMNNTYGKTMGYFSSVASWYNALIKNSEAYCRQMVLEAKTRILANQIAQKEQETHNLIYNNEGNKNKYSTKKETKDIVTGQVNAGDGKILPIYTTVEVKGSSDLDKVNAKIKSNNAGVKNLKNQLSSAVTESNNIKFKVRGSDKIPDLNAKKKTRVAVADPKTYEQLSTNIDIYKKKLTGENTEEQKIIREKIAKWTKQKEAIELAQKAAERPLSLNNLQDVDNEIKYQQTLRETASKKSISGIDSEIKRLELLRASMERPTELKTLQDVDNEIKYQQSLRESANTESIYAIDTEIKRLEDLRKQMERSGHTTIPIESIKTYEQLNQELSYYNEALTTATAAERTKIQLQINALDDLKKKWDDIQSDLKKPGDISTLNSIFDLDEAINYYGDLQKRQSADEIQNTQKTIDALEAKRKALQRGIDIPAMQKEVAQISGLSSKEFKLKVRGIGIDELKEKIKDLQTQLNDVNNPPTENQRKDIENLIGTYESWRSTVAHSFATYKEGWEGIKGFGDGINNITSALNSNGNAWQKITGIIDGFIQLYESISTIVGIINLLTTATTAHAAAKTAEAVATGATATATGIDAAAQAAAAVAILPVIVANKLATASFMELASAEYFAAHASLPFVGFGIAAGFVAAATTITQGIGVMPFANGGVISGPTLGLMGEYPGASNNPEVVAPLDKLRGMLKSNNVAVGGEFRVKGRDLVATIANETRISSKSGHRTNIKL